jgi:fatty acid desaturase
MDQFSAPPLPPRPDLEPPKPRGSCLVWLAVLFGFLASVVLTFLMIGFLWPFVIGFAILSIIALQYLVWGWWFERLYRSGADHTDTRLNREP